MHWMKALVTRGLTMERKIQVLTIQALRREPRRRERKIQALTMRVLRRRKRKIQTTRKKTVMTTRHQKPYQPMLPRHRLPRLQRPQQRLLSSKNHPENLIRMIFFAKTRNRQAASQRRKRQERDTFFKQQAEEKKRAQEAAKAEEKEGASTKDEAPEKRKRQIPKLLPLELLESDDEDDIPQRSDGAESSKRRKLAASEGLVREPKAPKDQKVGSTVFRVVANRGDQKLAPKRKKQSVNLKEDMLRRDRIPQQKRGFFVK